MNLDLPKAIESRWGAPTLRGASHRTREWFTVDADGRIGDKSLQNQRPHHHVPITKVGIHRNGTWYIDRDGDGGATEEITWGGVPGDLPVAGTW